MSNVKQLQTKVESLNGQIKNLTTENQELKKQNSELNSKLDALVASATMDPVQLEALLNNAAIASDNEALRKELEISQQQVVDLSKALSESGSKTTTPEKTEVAKPTGISTATFKVAGKTYSFAMPAVSLDGEKITAKEVLASTELQQRLVEMESGFIKEVK